MGWTPREPALARGAEWLWRNEKPRASDIYYTYHATQVFHLLEVGVRKWEVRWKPAMDLALLRGQITEKTKEANQDIGSWNADEGTIGLNCGKLGTTALSLLTLEVCARNFPCTNAKEKSMKGCYENLDKELHEIIREAERRDPGG